MMKNDGVGIDENIIYGLAVTVSRNRLILKVFKATRFEMTAAEACVFNKRIPQINSLVEKIQKHSLVFACMYGSITHQFKDIYDCLIDPMAAKLNMYTTDSADSYDLIKAYYHINVNPSLILDTFTSRLTRREMSCQFDYANVLELCLKNDTFIRECLSDF